MFKGGNIALAMAQFLGPKVGAVCVQVLLLPGQCFIPFHLNYQILKVSCPLPYGEVPQIKRYVKGASYCGLCPDPDAMKYKDEVRPTK